LAAEVGAGLRVDEGGCMGKGGMGVDAGAGADVGSALGANMDIGAQEIRMTVMAKVKISNILIISPPE
jgi:hypothetical protein